MDKIQKVLNEVERLQNELITEKKKGYGSDVDDACILELQNIKNYIKFVQKEPVSEEFKEAACKQLAENARKHKAETISPFFSPTDYKQGVIDGANWKEQQMMAETIDAHCFGFQGAALFSFRLPADKYLVGSEVKVIVIKEE